MEKDNVCNEDLSVVSQQEFSETQRTEQSPIKPSMEIVGDNPEIQRLRSSSVPADRIKQDNSEEEQLQPTNSSECPESQSASSKLISEALQQEDEFLEYLMSLPAVSKEKQQKLQQPVQPALMRSISTYGGNSSSGGGAKVGLDHLDNLCKLMEQLGDLREQNSKLQKRVQYLEDLKNLQEMHKQLQEESKRRQVQEVAFLQTLQQNRQISAKRHQHRRIIKENFPTPKRHGSEDSLNNEQTTTDNNKRNNKCKSMTNGKFGQSLLRYQQRGRSRSVGVEEIKQDKVVDERSGQDSGDTSKQSGQESKQQRRSVVGITGGAKAKVSKWTKVKEAFRWEKASVVMLPEAKSQDSGIGGISGGGGGTGGGSEDTRYLRVPSGDTKGGDNLLSVSPVDSVLSGHSSSACSSGGQSTGYLPCQHPLSDFTLPSATALSSSSSSEDLDIDLNFTDILAEYGPQRSASATDSTGGRLLVQDTRRRSLSQMPEEEDASRRSKSLDGDATIARHFAVKEGAASPGLGKHSHQKSHKTPWGKVKDIIQTRKDSLKKRQRHAKADSGSKGASEAGPSDHEEEPEAPRDSPDEADISAGTKTSPMKQQPRIEVSLEGATSRRQHGKISTSSLDGHLQAAADSPTSRRLTPVLTITLPSTEELRGPQAEQSLPRKPPPSPQSEDRLHKISTASAPAAPTPPRSHDQDDSSAKGENYKRQTSRPASSSAGTSPPVHRRASKWTKVKKAFLTSSAPGRRDDDGTGRISSSVPSSPNRNSSFFDEMDTDELSSGEYGDVVIQRTRAEDGSEVKEPSAHSASIHAEIQRNYEELQQKLSHEFHKKLHEWERIKAASAGSAAGGDDHDKGFRRKMEEWERMKHPQQGAKHRDSAAFQTLDEDNLSPDFRKKLQEWQRIKKSLPAGSTPQSSAESYAVPPHFKKKIAEWQLWRSGSGKSDGGHRGEDQAEWERVKAAASSSPSPETVAAQDGASPGIARKNSTGHSKGGSKKGAGNGKAGGGSPAADGPGPGGKEGGGASGAKGGGKVHQKGKSQKEKELQWLEKELHKIEREKQRLEREREKYLEREARLEKMRRAMGSGQRKQEVLIQTSTGFFRFQGISEKFTRRLYEWEKARGIGPEASTFALLDPGYRPPGNGGSSSHGGCSDNVDGNLLARSKSASSVTNLGTGVTNVGTSSLSLNDVEVLEQAEAAALEDSRAASEPHLRTTGEAGEDDEPAAVIVDVEDVIEETAAPLPLTPVVQSQTPVYCYAPEEVTRLIDSSGSDSERDGSKMVQRNDSVRTESSYKLLEENMSLLNRLKLKEDICRKLESDIENLEGKIDDVAKTHKQELQRLRREETDLQVHNEGEQEVSEASGGPQEELVAELRARIRELERRQEWLLREGETLQDSFAQHSQQRAALAQNLVGKMKQLQEANININMAANEPLHQSSSSHLDQQMDAINLVQDLSTQLLNLAEKLELALAERSREVYNLRFQLQDRRHRHHKLRSGQHWFSEEGMSVSMGSLAETENVAESGGTSTILPRQSSEELTQLPSLLTNKVLELKEGLNYLCNASGVLVSDQQKPKEYSPEATTTFVLKFGKRDESTADARGDPPAVVQVDSEGNTSPVTCVTITPAFWKKRDRSGEEDTTQDDGWGTPDLKADDTSPINRDSFCSAVSSASATSSVCDDDEEEKDADSYVSEMDNQDAQTSARAVGSDESANKKGDVSEASMNESDHDRSSDEEDEEDGDEDEDEEHSKIRSRDHEQEALLKNRNQNEQDSSQEYNYKSLFGEPYPGYYETEVYTSKGVGRQRKLLKTRRVSDTHVGYKHQKDSREEVAKTESSNSDYDSGNGKSVSDSASVETCRLEPTYSPQTPLNKSEEHETVSDRDLDDEQNQRECKSEADDKYASGSVLMGFRLGYPHAMDRRPGSRSDKASSCPQNISDSSSTHTPDNVFVKTTRKIFSPVRRDSKGKASSVVSYIVGETSPTSSIDRTRIQHEHSVPITSPIINVVRREQSNENSPAVLSKPKNGSSNMPTPAWMITKSRSQSSSPALTRRKGSSSVEKSSSSSDTNSLSSVKNKSTEGTFHSEANTIITPNMERKVLQNSQKDSEQNSDSVENIMPPKSILKDEHIDPKKKDVETESGLQMEASIENTKIEKCDKSSFPVSPSSSFPPLPQSPNPNRRDLFKVSTKETAPSIRMMIAKYNQKLTEQQEGAGGRSPEVGGSGSASPVAWRSPVAERRVRAQMEKYQEEVQRVLQQGGKRSAIRFCGSKLQKSVSDGVIRAPESPPVVTSESKDSEDTVTKKNLSLSAQPRSILKSPSAGSIKPTSSMPLTPISCPVLQPVLVESSSDMPTRVSPTKPPSPRMNTSPNPTSPSSPELGIHHSSPPPSRLRALRLQRAKEEFLTRGPGGQSWTSETGTPSSDTPSASVSPEPFWGREATSEPERDTVRPVLRIKEASSANRSRLSQISVESESSYDSSLMLPGCSRKNPRDVSDEGLLLVKSASAGMINVDPNTYRKFYADRGAGEPQPSTSDSQEGKQKTQSCSKFGISSITSRFRRVKMRKNKDREGGKMNAVSALCRQSLLVDLHLTKGSTSSGGAEAPGPSTSKSCPSSPVLQRSSSGEKSGSGTSSAPTSWILNPARKIFKPK